MLRDIVSSYKLRIIKSTDYKVLHIFSLLVILLFNILYSSASYSSTQTQIKSNARKEQVFRRGNGEEVESLDPHKATGLPANNILIDIYEGLMSYNQAGKLIYGQALSHKVSADLKTYTFTLRDNLKWSNGDKLTAHDFVAGMRRTVDPKVSSVYSDMLKQVKNAEAIIDGKLPVIELGVRAPNDKTVVIELTRPTPYLLEVLTHSTTYPIYRPNIKKYGDKFTQPGNLVSNGPFKLQDWVVHSHLTIVKNKNFREADQVQLDKVIFYPITEQSVELKRYRADDLDYTNIIPDVQFNWIKQNLKDQLYISPQLATYYYGFNLEQEPFKNNKNLRKAIALAIDKNIIAEKVLRSGQIATDFLVPDKTNNYRDLLSRDIKVISNLNTSDRLKLANDYLKKAGYTKQNAPRIKITYNTQESHKNIAIAISAMLKKNLGVKTELYNQEWKVFLRTRQERKETQLFREGWVGDYNDPLTFLDLYTSDNPQNHSGYRNAAYDKLIENAQEQIDLSKRAEILADAEALLLDDAPIIPLYTYVSRHLIKPYVKGFDTNVLDRTYDRYISIDYNTA